MRIVWYKRAYERFLLVSAWYAENMGRQAAFKFEKDTLAVVELLSKQPGTGMLDERRSTEEREYYSFLSHPLYRIVYRYRGYIVCCGYSGHKGWSMREV